MLKSIILLLLLFVAEYQSHFHQFRRNFVHPSKKSRISPKTGVRIALPTREQLDWQAQELGVLVCFNLATYLDSDGCTGQVVPNTSLFNPYLLNTDNWVQTMSDFGARYAVLVTKHACDFVMYPSNVTFLINPTGERISYNYTIDSSPTKGIDILDEFIKKL